MLCDMFDKLMSSLVAVINNGGFDEINRNDDCATDHRTSGH